ncbi:MAG: PAS domain S-box protein [Gammaproteobacteria bacterium]|nr:PAS domain S-box protein [Gammaproteobacteria bacterium]
MHDTEIHFRTLVEQSLVGIYLIQDNYFRYVNPQFCEIFGYRENEILGKLTVEDLVAESDRKLVTDNLSRRQEGKIKEAHYSFNGVRKDGAIINVEGPWHTDHRYGPAGSAGGIT